MPSQRFDSLDVPKTLGVGVLPTLVTSSLSIPLPPVSGLQDIYVHLDVSPPSEGSQKLDIFVGPDTETLQENLTCLHNSYQGSLFLNGVTYSTNRQVYANPLSKWIDTVTATGVTNWLLWLYNWSDFNVGTLNSWYIVYFYGADPSVPVEPLSPIARGLSKYLGTSVGYTHNSVTTRRIDTVSLGEVDAPIPILFPSKLGVSIVSIKNDDPEGTILLSLYKFGLDDSLIKIKDYLMVVPTGVCNFYFPSVTNEFTVGEHLFYAIDAKQITNASLAIQTTLIGV